MNIKKQIRRIMELNNRGIIGNKRKLRSKLIEVSVLKIRAGKVMLKIILTMTFPFSSDKILNFLSK